MDDSRAALVALVERDVRLVLVEALGLGRRQADPERAVAAAPARGVVMGRDAMLLGQRRPPRSWWARKKLSEPAVAIAADAEISSASAAAATIWAKR